MEKLEGKVAVVTGGGSGIGHAIAVRYAKEGAKAAVENFTRVWALELAGKNVRVNAISPVAIRTDIWNVPGLSEEESKKHEEEIASTIPCERFGEAEDIANVALFLVSDEANYITGSIYAVDGGMGAL